MIRKKKKSCKRAAKLLAVVLTFCVIGGMAPRTIHADQTGVITRETLIPSGVTVNSPTALSNIQLPQSSYGTLSWANPTYVPSKYQEACSVVFTAGASADFSQVSGWDSSSGTVTGTVLVTVKSLAGTVPSQTPVPSVSVTPVPVSPDPTAAPTQPPQESGNHTDSGDESQKNEQNDSTDVDKDNDYNKEETTDSEEESSDSSKDESQSEDEDSGKTEQEDGEEKTEDSDKEESKGESQDKEDSSDNYKEDSSTSDKSETGDKQEEDADKDSDSEDENNEDKNSQDKDSTEKDEIKDTEEEKKESSKDEDKTSDKKEDSEKEPEGINEIPAEAFEKDTRSQEADPEAELQDQASAAAENHTCNGITVSGDFLPWYVQFRVSSGSGYNFTNASNASVFQSYEFQLWDLLNDTEYEIPEGHSVCITVPVKEGYNYTIEHILDDGSIETIIPTVYGNTMIFNTSSFSPFGIAGSTSLVGGEIAEDGYSPTQKPSSSQTGQSSSGTGSSSSGQSSQSSGNNYSSSGGNSSSYTNTYSSGGASGSSGNSYSSGSGTYSSSSGYGGNKTAAVKTGDNTAVLPLILLCLIPIPVILYSGILIQRRNKRIR